MGLAEPPTPTFVEMARRLAAAEVEAAFDGRQVSFRLVAPTGRMEVVQLALPVRHPWLRDRDLQQVGRIEDAVGWNALVEANSRLQQLVASGAPASLRDKALCRLQGRVEAYVAELLKSSPGVVSTVVTPRARVMFSGKAVLAPPVGVRMDQVGLAEEIAWGLFGPIVAREMAGKYASPGTDKETRRQRDKEQRQGTGGRLQGTASDSRGEGRGARGERGITGHTAEETAVLDEIMATSWVIINRAPTVGPTSLMAFHPVRIAEPVIRMPVAVNRLMNADYDGDQAAVLLPLTEQAQREAGERLSLAGHLRRDPSILGQIIPYQEALWGLALLSLTGEGLERISRTAGAAVQAQGGCVTHESLLAALQPVLREQGSEKTLATIDALTQPGVRGVPDFGRVAGSAAGRERCPARGADGRGPRRVEGLHRAAARRDRVDARLRRPSHRGAAAGRPLWGSRERRPGRQVGRAAGAGHRRGWSAADHPAESGGGVDAGRIVRPGGGDAATAVAAPRGP